MSDDTFCKIIVCGIIVFVSILIGVIYLDVNERPKLMKQCLDDGYKEYECNAILSRCGSHIAPIGMRVK